ncbi:MAG TPA: tlde1 domain-containing protein [Roseiarcus sp.]|nr:tlde1 domain-containing protein [Roseiarcus sp.]
MQGIEATFDGLSFEGGRDSRKSLLHLAFGASALALIVCTALALHPRSLAHRDVVVAAPPAKPAPAPAPEDVAKLFGQIVIEPEWAAKPAPANTEGPQTARLEAAPPMPLPSLDAFPAAPPSAEASPAPSVATAEPEGPPLPPERDVARLEENVPLPPPRPRELGPAEREPERRVAQPPTSPTPADNGDIFQKMFGWMHPALPSPSAPGVASRPAAPPIVASVAPENRTAVAAVPTAPASGDARGGRGWFSGFMSRSNPTASYDGYTAVYDISARAVYLPDGTRLEAHSGLGDRLDDPRYVNERARGATPPHLYELTMRESLFHGVQALRLTPIGEGGVYGRAGLLAHPYMLGPKGDSNGCVSVKEYNALLRAFQNGQIKRLAVVASL